MGGGERPRKLNWLKMVALWFKGFETYECTNRHMIVSCFPCVYPNQSLSCTLLDPGEPLFLSFLFFLRPEGLEGQVTAQDLGHDDATLTYLYHELGGGREEVDGVCECV